MDEYGSPQDPPFSYWFPAPPPPVDHEQAGPQGPGGSPPRRRGRSALAVVLSALLLLGSGVAIGWGFTRSSSQLVAPGGSASNGTGSAAATVTPGVVDVNTFVSLGSYPFSKENAAPLGA